MRTFIAVKIPEEIKEKILQKISPFRDKIKGRFVKKTAMHITLKFLGEIDEEQKNTLCGILPDILKHYAPFAVRFNGAGTFPPKKPRVLWFGVEKGAEELSGMASVISERIFEELGIKDEKRKFVPHFTVARLKSPYVPEEFFRQEIDFSFPVDSVYFIRSFLKPSGAEYSDLASFHL